MNQADIIKGLLTEYINEGGNVNDLEAAAAYCELHKPEGSGRVNPVIAQAILRLMGHRPTPQTMLTETPPAVIEAAPAPIVIATATVKLPEVMQEKPVAVFRETAPESEPVPDKPAPVQKPQDPVEVSPSTPKPQKGWLNKLKFWK